MDENLLIIASLSCKELSTEEIMAANNGLHFTDEKIITQKNAAYKKLFDYSLIDQNGKPYDFDSLALAISRELTDRVGKEGFEPTEKIIDDFGSSFATFKQDKQDKQYIMPDNLDFLRNFYSKHPLEIIYHWHLALITKSNNQITFLIGDEQEANNKYKQLIEVVKELSQEDVYISEGYATTFRSGTQIYLLKCHKMFKCSFRGENETPIDR